MNTPVNTEPTAAPEPAWDEAFRSQFRELLRWRRDVRHFRTDPVPRPAIDAVFDAACLAPSVGNAQPWRFVEVESAPRRQAIVAIFERENLSASAIYGDARAASYRALKLAGLREAPIHLAVFCDEATPDGSGLGRQTMPEMLRYSVVCAVHNLWLAARTHGLGVGWVSILNPSEVCKALDVPGSWQLVAYLCIGWPAYHDTTPELERQGWQARHEPGSFLFKR